MKKLMFFLIATQINLVATANKKVEIVPFDVPFSVIDTALFYNNIIDIGGKKTTQEIQKFLASVGLQGNYPYCQAFSYYCMNARGFSDFRTANANRYYDSHKKKYGSYIGEVQNKPGLICWVNPATFGNTYQSGHIGFMINTMPLGFVRTIEGNTSSDERLYAGKRGVFVRVRPIGNIGNKELRGIIQGRTTEEIAEKITIEETLKDYEKIIIIEQNTTEEDTERNIWEYAWILLFGIIWRKLNKE